ncbi:hypothetical protein ACFLQR_00400 [Verrucomicrobiota bacterium]
MCQKNDLATRLWNEDIAQKYSNPDKCMDHLLEQYKLYVEMADRISARRAMANTFFLTVNTLMVAGMAAYLEKMAARITLLAPLAGLILCYVWQRLIRSYRQLNRGKYKVIGEMEKRLPCSPYWSAEWTALGEGKDPKKYKPLTAVEVWVPVVFMALYTLLAVVITKQYWLGLLKACWAS